MSDRCAIIAWGVSLDRGDGGGRRTSAFIDAVEKLGVRTEIVAVGPTPQETDRRVNESRLHAAKRRFLPLPLRGTVTADLKSVAVPENVLSLVPAAHGFAVKNAPRAWLDYSDLWSHFSGDAADRWTGPLESVTRRAQARLWSNREHAECDLASVVTMAGLADAKLMSRFNARWLPVPVMDASVEDMRSRNAAVGVKTRGQVRAGFLANFGYPPNREAFAVLVENWLPVLLGRRVSVVVAGFDSDTLPKTPGVEILGSLSNLDEFYSSIDFILVPVAAGGGMKVKVVEAMSRGKRVLGSAHAFENLPEALAAAGLLWQSYVDKGEIDTSDPRTSASVAEALRRFEVSDFNERVAAIWNQSMAR